MEQIINDIIQSILGSFDFAFCLIVNIATYGVIKLIDGIIGVMKGVFNYDISRLWKRVILIIIILLTGVLYKVTNADDIRVLINSAILAPVSWSWIFKPIFKYLHIDYKKEDGKE